MREGAARLPPASTSGCRPATNRICSAPAHLGVRPFAAFSGSYRAFAPHANIAYQWNGRSVLAGDVRAGIEAASPGSVSLRRRQRLQRQHPFQHGLRRPRPARAELAAAVDLYAAATGAAGSADLPDIRFATDPYWATDGALGFKANVAAHLLVNFNLRFNLGDNGLADRIAPLIGIEWSF